MLLILAKTMLVIVCFLVIGTALQLVRNLRHPESIPKPEEIKVDWTFAIAGIFGMATALIGFFSKNYNLLYGSLIAGVVLWILQTIKRRRAM